MDSLIMVKAKMSYLEEKLAEIDRNVVIDDTVSLIDQEVASKSGLTGMALKGGYKGVRRLKGGRMIHKAVNHMLDDFTQALAPLHEDFRAQQDTTAFGAFLLKHQTRASEALLGITDAKIKEAQNKVVISTYSKLRKQAGKHVVDALPGVGRLIDKHVPHSP